MSLSIQEEGKQKLIDPPHTTRQFLSAVKNI